MHNLPTSSHAPSANRIASEFRIVGWIGFFLQLALGLIPIFIAVPVLFFGDSQRRMANRYSMGTFFAYACLFVLLFTIYWCFRYTRLSKKIDDPCLRRIGGRNCCSLAVVSNYAPYLLRVNGGMEDGEVGRWGEM
jgi:hypothetical protein